MQSHVFIPQSTIEQVIHQIFVTGRISRIEQQRLMSALLSKELISMEEKTLVDKLFNAIQKGIVKILD